MVEVVIDNKKDFLENIDNQRVHEKLLPKNKKQKREKKSIALKFLLDKKRKPKKPPSEIAKWASEILKRDLRTRYEIEDFLDKEKVKIDAQTKKLYQTIVDTKVINGNVVLSDVLANKPIYMIVPKQRLKGYCVTNDALFLELMYNNVLKFKDERYAVFARGGKIHSCQICSLPINCNGVIKKGYYQDFYGDFAAVGLGQLDSDDRAKMLKGEIGEQVEFTYKGKKFLAIGNIKACVIAEKDKDEKFRADAYNAMKILDVSTKVSISEKTLNVDDKIKYIDVKLRPETFCPAFMIMPEQFMYTCCFKVELDYNKFFADLENDFIKNKKIGIPSDIFSWENMNGFFDFLGVFSITARGIGDNEKDELSKIYKRYIELKDYLDAWKSLQISVQKKIREFYVSFASKINFDKLVDLDQYFAKYLYEREAFERDLSYEQVKTFVTSDCEKFSKVISKQFSDKFMTLVKEIKRILGDISTDNVSDEVVSRLQKLGIAIYQASLSGIDSEAMLPYILSPGAFFGNVAAGKDLKVNYIKEILENLKVEHEKKDGKVLDKIENDLDLINNLRNIRQRIILNTLWKDKNLKNTGLSEVGQNEFAYKVADGLTEKESEELNRNIVKAKREGKDPNNLYYPNKTLENEINKLVQAENKRKIEAEKRVTELNLQKARIEKELSETRSNTINEEEDEMLYDQGQLRSARNWYIDLLKNGFPKLREELNKFGVINQMTLPQIVRKYPVSYDEMMAIVYDFDMNSLENAIKYGYPGYSYRLGNIDYSYPETVEDTLKSAKLEKTNMEFNPFFFLKKK